MAVYRRESRRRPIIALIVITCLALITLDSSGNGVIGTVRHTARDAIAPVQGLVDDAFDPVANVFDGVTKVDGLEERERQAAVAGRRARGQAQPGARRRRGVQPARSGSSTSRRRGRHRCGGPGHRRPGRQLRAHASRSTRARARGSSPGMPIVAGDGLVGKVTDASRTQATVTLIDSPGLGVGRAHREEPRAGGHAGALGRPAAAARASSTTPVRRIEEGELAVHRRASTARRYPPDVPVARVVKIDRDRGDLDPDVFVEPLVDLDKLDLREGAALVAARVAATDRRRVSVVPTPGSCGGSGTSCSSSPWSCSRPRSSRACGSSARSRPPARRDHRRRLRARAPRPVRCSASLRGIAIDCFLSSPMGVSALAFSLTGYGVGVFQSGLVRCVPLDGPDPRRHRRTRRRVPLDLHRLDRGPGRPVHARRAFRILVIAAIYDALVAFLIFPFARWACGEHDFAHR